MLASNSKGIEKRQRRQEGWLAVQAAAKLLLEKYHVEKVALFGSLLDPRLLRRHSDIDLAVWGLSDGQYYQAVRDLSGLGSDFSFDLVQFESAQPSLQNVILQRGLTIAGDRLNFSHGESFPLLGQLEIAVNDHAVLFGLIEQELKELETLAEKNQALLNKLRATQDEDYLGTIALNLHGFYCGVERVFKQIAQTVDGSVPDAADWHRQLLRQMAAPVRHIRPAVLRTETLEMLNEYCSFRHVVRNIYSVNLKLERVAALAEELPACLKLLQEDLQNLTGHISTKD